MVCWDGNLIQLFLSILKRLFRLKNILLTFFFNIILIIDKLFIIVFKKSFLRSLLEFLNDKSYSKTKILNKEIKFFTPTKISEYRVKTLFTKEPDTIKWIDSFDNSKEFTFWDIGANIGLYSIYNSIKNPNSKTISFEGSTSNLRLLSRNISINMLNDNISIFQIPLTKDQNKFLSMNESEFIEGSALNTFGENFNFKGQKFKVRMNYKIFGTNINYLVKNNIIDLPEYIKIDVDGIEHLILEGFGNYLNSSKIRSILIEINEDFLDQSNKIFKIMKENKFDILSKSKMIKNIYNYIFLRK